MRILIVISAIALLLATSACNTMEGLGQDVQTAGNKLKKAAQ